jgi:flagella basal body P-ring formation protein FlgA
LFGSFAVATLLSGTTLLAAGSATDQAIAAAIEQAVRARMGGNIIVRVTELTGVRVTAAADAIVAQPEPAAKIGAPIRFVLSDRGSRGRVGEATATVRVTADAVKARHDITRGATLGSGDIAVEPVDLSGQPFGPLPSLEEAIGAKARRNIGIDDVVTRADIAAEPLVRAGDIVRAHVRVGGVEVIGTLVAAEPGVRDEVIRVVNAETRHTTRARVVGSGEVEVVNGP